MIIIITIIIIMMIILILLIMIIMNCIYAALNRKLLALTLSTVIKSPM